jgi:DNA repair exonuclease SbcCD ATPase subunit/DNA repair exonuclease SbcCD nuclease subunit
MIKILHIADLHIHNDEKRHKEYNEQFNKLYDIVKNNNIDIITIVGDLFESNLNISNEAKLLCGNFLNTLSTICKEVVVVYGNHDLSIKMKNRVNSVETVVNLIDNKKITYFNKSDFYQDKIFDEIVWVNFAHAEKNINPWLNIPHIRNKNKVYIDLYHNPVYSCTNDFGFSFEKTTLKKSSDFLGNISMFGDIHKRQEIVKNKCMSGSLIQQNFGESPKNHGGIIWTIKSINDISFEFFDIENDHNFINLYIKETVIYDNLSLKNEDIKSNSEIKIHWTDYSANINLENEQKIRDYLIDKYNIHKVKFEKTHLYSEITQSKIINESININDKVLQQNIFREYLKLNKFDDDFVEEIIKIDDIINDRLNSNETINNIHWNIDKFWLENFKSFDKFEIDWKDISGIIQIFGENQQGKTSILDGICYILFGTTLATNKLGGGLREKHGDNRYINNKRDLNYCKGGMVININGENYTLLRKTEREINKGQIKSVSTNIEYYYGTEVKEANKVPPGERRTKTEQYIQSIIGTFDDFIRLVLTNADNLNTLISMDRATFVDSVIRDAGYDIFEKKLAEFKEYKKELKDEKIDIDINLSNIEISKLEADVEAKETQQSALKDSITFIDDEIKELDNNKELEIKKLHKIDEQVKNLNISDLNIRINEYKNGLTQMTNKMSSNNSQMLGLKKEYDKESLDKNYLALKKNEDDVLNFKLKLSQLDNSILKERSTGEQNEQKLKNFKENEINNILAQIKDLNAKIKETEKNFDTEVERTIQKLNVNVNDIDSKISLNDLKLKNIKETGIKLKKEIKELEESKVCPTCGREFDADKNKEHLQNIRDIINEKNEELNDLFEDVKPIVDKNKDLNEQKIEILNQISGIKEGKYTDDLNILQSHLSIQVEGFNYDINVLEQTRKDILVDKFTDAMQEKIETFNKVKANCIKNIKKYKLDKENINQEINKINETLETIKSEVSILEKDKDQAKSYKSLYDENEMIKVKLDNIKLNLEKINTMLDKYNEQVEYIKSNQIIEAAIEKIKSSIQEKEDKKSQINDEIMDINQLIVYGNKNIDDLKRRIAKYKEQVKREEILKTYQTALHRDGIPSFLLRNNINVINNEMSTLLSDVADVDFTLFFNEDIQLKMYHNIKPESIFSNIEGSGMERSFSALILKFCLRVLNNKSRPNFMFLDEITAKLVNGETIASVDKFVNLLEYIKKKVDKIVIIEHIHEVNPDMIIDVRKDKDGVSHVTF